MPATNNLRTTLGGNATRHDQIKLNKNIQDLVMARPCEMLFVDPSVSDLDTILGGLRPEVEAVVLDTARPAARQIAAALEGREGLSTVHVIAHGAPGRVSFAAGEWSAETLEEEADDFAAIGKALAEDGDLRLWSCHTGAGAVGDEFVDGLARATGAHVAAATDFVGSAARGGRWVLEGVSGACVARAPLTAAGVAEYSWVFSVTLASRGEGERLKIFGRWPAGTKAGTYFIILNKRGTLEVLGKFTVPVDTAGTFAISEPIPAGIYTVGPTTAGPGTIAVYNGRWNKRGRAAGKWSVSDFNTTITATLNDTRNITSNDPSFSGVVL